MILRWPALLRRLAGEGDEGQTLVEYALLIAMISILVIVALVFLGPILSRVFQNVGTTLNSA
jgi:Flp pilus assembly pilin Flp